MEFDVGVGGWQWRGLSGYQTWLQTSIRLVLLKSVVFFSSTTAITYRLGFTKMDFTVSWHTMAVIGLYSVVDH
jgi:hypothetical protein